MTLFQHQHALMLCKCQAMRGDDARAHDTVFMASSLNCCLSSRTCMEQTWQGTYQDCGGESRGVHDMVQLLNHGMDDLFVRFQVPRPQGRGVRWRLLMEATEVLCSLLFARQHQSRPPFVQGPGFEGCRDDSAVIQSFKAFTLRKLQYAIHPWMM